MTRPGSRTNAWIRDEDTGDVVLRDGSGTEYARFPDADAVFTDRGPYPSDGETTVKEPIIPEAALDSGVDPHAEIVTVPEDAADLVDLSLWVGTDMTIPTQAVGGGDHVDGAQSGANPGADVTVEDLDISATTARFYELLQTEADRSVTSGEAQDLAAGSGDPDLDVSRRTIRTWLGNLVDVGALWKGPGDHAAAPDEYYLR